MDKTPLQELIGQSVAAVTKALPELDRESLVELQALETAGADRAPLQRAIEKQLALLDDAPEGGENASMAVDGKGEPAAKAAGKLDATHWQHPDYHGALSGEQAHWRVHNIKPAATVVTK